MASQAANYCDDATMPGFHEAVRRLCFVHNFDNHDVNYDFVNDSFAKNACYVLYHLIYVVKTCANKLGPLL